MKTINKNSTKRPIFSGKTVKSIFQNYTGKQVKTGLNSGFTLVELIIVITILAILATISFISFQNYTKDSRDSSRLATIKNIETGLETLEISLGKYPNPDDIYGTGVINGVTLTYVGNVGDNISRIIKINKLPLDPVSNEKYVYGTSVDGRYYQIAGVLENLSSYNNLIQTAYANSSSYKAKVNGNFNGLLKYNGYLYNIPSLIFVGSGNLLSSDTYFIVNKKENLPYKLSSETVLGNKTTSTLLQELTGTSSVTLTGVNISSITDKTTFLSNSGVLKSALGYDVSIIGKEIFGEKYFSEVNVSVNNQVVNNSCATEPNYTGATFTIGTPTQVNQSRQGTNSSNPCYYTCGTGKVLDEGVCVSETCAGTTPDGTAKVSNATSFAGGTWNYNPAGAKCSYTCGTGYHTEDSGVTCVSNTRSCSITNGVGSQIWTTSWGTCEVVSCNTNYTASGTTACTDQTPPTGGDFTIPATTNSTNVTLTVTCPTDVAGSTPIQVAYGNTASPTNWTTCTSSISHTLTTGDGTKTVYVRFKDSVGNMTGDVSGVISLDSTSLILEKYNGATQNAVLVKIESQTTFNTLNDFENYCATKGFKYKRNKVSASFQPPSLVDSVNYIDNNSNSIFFACKNSGGNRGTQESAYRNYWYTQGTHTPVSNFVIYDPRTRPGYHTDRGRTFCAYNSDGNKITVIDYHCSGYSNVCGSPPTIPGNDNINSMNVVIPAGYRIVCQTQ